MANRSAPTADSSPPRPSPPVRTLRAVPLLVGFAAALCLAAPLVRAALRSEPPAIDAAGSPARAGAPSPNLLLITVDSLRPDALGWIAARNETPAIDRLALGGVRFPGASSPIPLTLPAHASLVTGRLPRRHGVRDDGMSLPRSVPTLAERLRARGYDTAAFVSGSPLVAAFGLERGFAVYDDRMPEGSEGSAERKAFDTATAALVWIGKAREPFFCWVHFYDPHEPYEPPRSFARTGPRGAYDGEVAYVDAWIGKLREGVPKGAAERLLTVLTADHGEALGEYREKTHGEFLDDSTVRVPLVFHFPGRLAPRESREPARLIDVAPTVLDLLGVAPLPDVDGRSLRPLLEGRRALARNDAALAGDPTIRAGAAANPKLAPLAGGPGS